MCEYGDMADKIGKHMIYISTATKVDGHAEGVRDVVTRLHPTITPCRQ